ncbi:MAG: hypothetical protein ACT4PN_16245 [Nitrospiraceae bacterium]
MATTESEASHENLAALFMPSLWQFIPARRRTPSRGLFLSRSTGDPTEVMAGRWQTIRTEGGKMKVRPDPKTGNVVITMSAKEAARYAKVLFESALKSNPEMLVDHTQEPSTVTEHGEG